MKSMKLKLTVGLAGILAMVPCGAQEAKRIDVGANPESVTKGFGGNYFVTLMGAVRNDGDGDGAIVVIEDDKAKPFGPAILSRAPMSVTRTLLPSAAITTSLRNRIG